MESYDPKKDIFELVYMSAMRDALGQKAYGGPKIGIMNDKKNGVREILQEHVDSIIKGTYSKKSQEDYDKDFYELAKKICESIKKDQFVFGNAQKLINMTVKYFYLLVYKDSDIRSHFQYCHCPMDRIIKYTVIKKYRASNKNSEFLYFLEYGVRKQAWPEVAWSQIEDKEPSSDVKYGIDVYKNFQSMVRELSGNDPDHIFPIEYDYKYYYPDVSQ